MSQLFESYIECAFFAEMDDEDVPLSANYDLDDIDVETLEQMKKDCDLFEEMAGDKIQGNLSHAGHDFWLTRNLHGVGFWDGDWKENGDELTELCEKFPKVDLYIGDDGKVHQTPLGY